MAKIASALSGVVRGGTFGLLDPITKAVYPAGAKILEKSKAANPTESAAGELVGTVGSAFTNPATVGASGIGALRAAIPGAKLLPTLARNAIMTGTAAVPQAAGELAQGEGAGKVAGNFAKNMALGTALGSGAEGLARGGSRVLNGLQAKAMGLSSADLQKALQGGAKAAGLGKAAQSGYAASHGEDLLKKVVDLGNKNNAYTRTGKQKILSWITDGYGKLASLYDKAGEKVADNLDSVISHPSIQEAIPKFGQDGVDNTILDLSGKVDQMGWTKGRLWLNDFIRASKVEKDPENIIKLKGAVAEAIKDHMGQQADKLGSVARNQGVDITPLDDLDKMYGASRAFNKTLGKGEGSIPTSFVSGSDTSARSGILAKMIQPGLGALSGGSLAAGSQAPPQSPEEWLPYIGKVAGASLLGGALNRVGAKVGNVALGRMAQLVSKALPTAERLAPRIAGRAMGGGVETPVLANSEQNQSTGSIPASSPADRSVQQQEQIAEPEHIAAAKEATNSAWSDTVREKLDALYDAYLSQYGDIITMDDFLKQADELTNHFDPRKTAGFVFTDQAEKENYLKSYEAALRLQNLQKEYTGNKQDFIGEALNPGRARLLDPGNLPGMPTHLMGGAKNANERIAYNQLRDWAASLMTEQGKAPAKATIDQVSKDLDTIIEMKIPAERKRQLVIDHLANYGLNVEQLMKYGQIGGLS
jgi:hypothetical protein